MSVRGTKQTSALMAAALVALTLAACGEGNGEATRAAVDTATGSEHRCGFEDTGQQTDIGPCVGEKAEEARKLGLEAAGPPVKLPVIKTGFLQIAGAAPSSQRSEFAATKALETLGWPITRCDAEGVPAKMAACADSLLDQGVQFIVSLGVEPTIIQAQLKRAKALGVPVVNYAGIVADDPLWSGNYAPDETKHGEVLADWLMKRLASVDGSKEIFVESFPGAWAEQRTQPLLDAIAGSDVKVGAEATADLANPIEGTRRTATDVLTANPDLKAMWYAYDSSVQYAAPAVRAKAKRFPDGPLLVGFDADHATAELIRNGAVDAVSDTNYASMGWVVADQAAQFFARDQSFSTEQVPEYPIDYVQYTVITEDNLPPEGYLVTPEDDLVTFFISKWKKEFDL